jgi:predicted membrane metal-binding protein
VGALILAMLAFLAKFIGSLCLIILAMIVFTILFIVIVGLGWLIVQTAIEIFSDKYSVFKKEQHEDAAYTERNP